MKRKYTYFALLVSLFPQTALAHFTENHAPFWQEPMHYLLQHYQGAFVAVGIVIGIVIYLKKVSGK